MKSDNVSDFILNPLGVWPLGYALHKDTLCLFRSQRVFGCQEKPETNRKGAIEYRFGGKG